MPLSLAALASRQRWLDPVDSTLDGAIAAGLNALGSRRATVAGWLHGDPFGHPLHVMLTDVPLGSWTAALVFDRLAGGQGRGPWPSAARGAIAVGIVGALGAAITGLADWQQLSSRQSRRIGLMHGALNVLGLAAFTISFVRRRRPGAGHRSALAGYAIAATAAQLGGTLIYQHGAGLRPQAVNPQAAGTSQPAA